MAKLFQNKNFGNIILCSEVITDISRKLTFVGCFTNDIVVSSFPATVRMTLHVEYLAKLGDTKFDVYWSYNQKPPTTEFRGVISGGDPKKGVSALTMPTLDIGFGEPGTLVIEASVDDGKRVRILEKNVILGDVQRPYLISSPSDVPAGADGA